MNERFIHFLLSAMLLATVLAAVTTAFGVDSTKQQKQTGKSAKAPADPNVCALLTSAEIRSVQGETVEETKPSQQANGGLPLAECLFRTTTPAKSVSVAMAVPGKQSPRDFWRKQFHASAATAKPAHAETHPEKGQKKAGIEDKEEDDESTRPRAIPSVGDEAFWVGGPISGALYVLRGNKFIRISVGGVRDESERIRKSVALAQSALKRM
jgi:hypothetical protein